MGRPREHDAGTAAALLDAAERIVESEGLAALSVRRVADEVGTTTRAVYSLFGSMSCPDARLAFSLNPTASLNPPDYLLTHLSATRTSRHCVRQSPRKADTQRCD